MLDHRRCQFPQFFLTLLLVQATVELRFIRSHEEQQKILHACHRDPTSGHMAQKRTLARISGMEW